MSNDAITRDDLSSALAAVNRDRCDTCSKHEAHESRLTRLEQQQDKMSEKFDAMSAQVTNLRTEMQQQMGALQAELVKAKTTLAAIVLISSPVWTSIVGAVVYFVARGGH